MLVEGGMEGVRGQLNVWLCVQGQQVLVREKDNRRESGEVLGRAGDGVNAAS